MLDLDILEWLLLFCRQPLFRRFLVGFFPVGWLGHFGEGRNFGHGGHTDHPTDHRSWTRTSSSLEPTSRLQSLLRPYFISLDSFSVLTSTSALAKAGYKVIHVDPNDYYGGDHATLNVDEIISWANSRSSVENESTNEYLAGQQNKYISVSYHGSPPSASRQYSLSLSPSIIPSVGPLISTLVNSGVSRYGGFKLLEKVALYRSPGRVQNVPSSKEDVFNNRHISLIDKRRLMRFFTFVSGDFEDKQELHGKESASFINFLTSTFTLERTIAETIVFALAFCISLQGLWLPRNHTADAYINRANVAGSEASAPLPSFQWPLWTLPFPRRPLRRFRRACTRILSCLGRKRKYLRSEPQYVLNFSKFISVSLPFHLAQWPGRSDKFRLAYIFHRTP